MKRALFVLALAVLSSAGCQSMGPKCGQTCCDTPAGCGQPCHLAIRDNAPRPGGYHEGGGNSYGRGGCLEKNCQGGRGCLFDRYGGSKCGRGYPNGDYDCSPCNSCDWGCNGYRHPHGYVDNHPCLCQNGQCGPGGQCGANGQCGCQQCCPNNYCSTGPAPGCQCCPACGCGPSGDDNYNFNPGPPVAQTAYPYYTLRGPRDYLMGNPPSIGPY